MRKGPQIWNAEFPSWDWASFPYWESPALQTRTANEPDASPAYADDFTAPSITSFADNEARQSVDWSFPLP